MCDIPSEENLADVGTRPNKKYTDEEYCFRCAKSWERLINALHVYEQQGATFVSRILP